MMRRRKVGIGLILMGCVVAAFATARLSREGAPRHPTVIATLLARVDTDGDGFVDQEEYAAVAMEDDPLEAFDANGDGRLGPDELEEQFLSENPTEWARSRRAPARRPTASHDPTNDITTAPPTPTIPPPRSR